MKHNKRKKVLISRLAGYARLIGHSDRDLTMLPKRFGGYTRPGSNKRG